jgi:glutamate--cysteine ligase
VKIAHFGATPEARDKYRYRQGLCHRYGKMMQTICGIHYNVSFTPELFQALGLTPSEGYFKIIRNFYRCYPLLIYLFGASPFCYANSLKPKLDCSSFLTSQNDVYIGQTATSLRQSELGYHNPYVPDLSPCYNSLASYLKALEKATTTVYEPYLAFPADQQLNANYLQIENEYYAPIRPKANPALKSRPLIALQQGGVAYIEVRLLDLNPLLPLGIDESSLAFIDLFLLHCLFTPDQLNINCKASKEKAPAIAKFGRAIPAIVEEGLAMLENLKPLVTHLNQSLYYTAWDAQLVKLQDPAKLPSSQILESKRFT